ncbi:hypothetical protein AB0D49_17280 [Streptomyces sp. NPDC048290]|uniref:hypothetical protein n=1 Tax=Streptomyces sp. NPDC048290 TaxID=3155811 RepID=UPI0034432D78
MPPPSPPSAVTAAAFLLPVLPVLPVVLAVLVLLAVPASAAEGWSAAPAGGGRPSFYAEGTPGTALRDTVSVTNRTAAPVDVRLTATGVEARFSDAELRVPPRTRAEIPFTVTVPRDAPPGDRAGELVVRDADGRTNRLALRLRTGGPELSALTVERTEVVPEGIRYDLVNRGTTTLAPALAVRAEGVFGTVLDRPARPLDTKIPPGRRVTLTEPWPDRPALDTVEIRLTATAGEGVRAQATASAPFVPWRTLTTTAAALTLAALITVRRRRRRLGGTTAGDPRPAPELTGART